MDTLPQDIIRIIIAFVPKGSYKHFIFTCKDILALREEDESHRKCHIYKAFCNDEGKKALYPKDHNLYQVELYPNLYWVFSHIAQLQSLTIGQVKRINALRPNIAWDYNELSKKVKSMSDLEYVFATTYPWNWVTIYSLPIFVDFLDSHKEPFVWSLVSKLSPISLAFYEEHDFPWIIPQLVLNLNIPIHDLFASTNKRIRRHLKGTTVRSDFDHLLLLTKGIGFPWFMLSSKVPCSFIEEHMDLPWVTDRFRSRVQEFSKDFVWTHPEIDWDYSKLWVNENELEHVWELQDKNWNWYQLSDYKHDVILNLYLRYPKHTWKEHMIIYNFE
jgi:hypothetical protein